MTLILNGALTSAGAIVEGYCSGIITDSEAFSKPLDESRFGIRSNLKMNTIRSKGHARRFDDKGRE
jgi:hypothetical protein